MSFKTAYPQYAAIEGHIHRAHAERSVMLAEILAGFMMSASRGFKSFAGLTDRGLAEERDRRAVEADPFLKRSVPRY